MKIIKADPNRRIELPGAPAPVQRPVDIDRTKTDFTNLRSLRIYRFDGGSVIDGHAEEDEVFVVVIAGSITLTISDENDYGLLGQSSLCSASDSQGHPIVAYLPPHSTYKLVAETDADIAYLRATPSQGSSPSLFTRHVQVEDPAIRILLEETTYAERLCLRLVQINAANEDVTFMPLLDSEAACEALVHVRTEPAEGAASTIGTDSEAMPLDSWDTLCVEPRKHPALRFTSGSSALVLVAMAH